MDSLALVMLSVLPALVIAAAISDLTTMTIPNWISAILVVAFFPAAFLVELSPWLLLTHVGVGFAALVAGAGMFALRWIGGGDAKLMAAACLWLGLQGSGAFLLWTGVIGGGFCLLLIAARSSPLPISAFGPPWVGRLMEPKGDIPYGVAIAAGALMAFPASGLVSAFSGG